MGVIDVSQTERNPGPAPARRLAAPANPAGPSSPATTGSPSALPAMGEIGTRLRSYSIPSRYLGLGWNATWKTSQHDRQEEISRP
jgi:hypothetical protein